MAIRGTLLLILVLAFALMAVGLIEGVSGTDTSFVRRRLAGHELLEATATTVVPVTGDCPLICGGIENPFFPTCCQIDAFPFLTGPAAGSYFCANTEVDILNCGTCGNSCLANGITQGTLCCSGKCTNVLTDSNNCGVCGNKCPGSDQCRSGLCNYAD